MKEKDISGLLERYEQMLISGKNVYFDADEYDELADYYDKLDDIETAKDIVNLGLKIHPNNESLMLRYARFLVYDTDYSTALNYLNANFNTYEFELYLLKIECLLQLGLYAEAHQLTSEVLADEETETELILSELGFLYVEAEYFDEAILYFEKSLEYDPENNEVLSDLAYAYEAKGDFKSAINVCERMLDIDPYFFDAWLMLGKLHSLREDYEKAIDAFDFALTLDDSNVNILKLKAHCLLLSNRLDEAVDVLTQCIAITPDDGVLYLTLADCYINMEQYDKALVLLDEYDSKLGESGESMAKKAYAFFLKGDIAESKRYIDNAVQADGDSYDVVVIAGDLYSRWDALSEAESFYKKALTIREDESEEILEKMVSFYVSNNDLDNAILYQKKLLEVAQTILSQKKLALLYLEAGQQENFKSYLKTFSNELLLSFFQIFFDDEQMDLSSIDRDYILKRLDNVYEYRLLYKNIKY